MTRPRRPWRDATSRGGGWPDRQLTRRNVVDAVVVVAATAAHSSGLRGRSCWPTTTSVPDLATGLSMNSGERESVAARQGRHLRDRSHGGWGRARRGSCLIQIREARPEPADLASSLMGPRRFSSHDAGIGPAGPARARGAQLIRQLRAAVGRSFGRPVPRFPSHSNENRSGEPRRTRTFNPLIKRVSRQADRISAW